ncbi:MAG: RagB/SusD family nutrient uptake outer membrane protein [Rikenellaceae bacterium]
MKKTLLSLALLCATISCTEVNVDEPAAPSANANSTQVTVTVAASSDADTRVSVDEQWRVTWSEGESLFAWSQEDNATSTFSMTGNYSPEASTFTGTVSGSTYRLLTMPEGANDPGIFDIYIWDEEAEEYVIHTGGCKLYIPTTQTPGLNATYMISTTLLDAEEADTDATPSMMHLGAAAVLNVRYTNLGDKEYYLAKAVVSGVPTSLTVDLSKEIPTDIDINYNADVVDDDFYISVYTFSNGSITLNPEEPIAVSAGDSELSFNIPAFYLESGASISVMLYLVDDDGNCIVTTKTITNEYMGAIEFKRATYNNINITCDIEAVITDYAASTDVMLTQAYTQLKTWSDPMHRSGEYAGDNIMLRGTSTDVYYQFISYTHTADNYRMTNFWNYGYEAIRYASLVMEYANEGVSDEIDQRLGEAYYIRGMVYFYLCRAYGRPYYDNPTTNLGVPIVNGFMDTAITPILPDRSTVAEVYAQAISDLEKSIELMNEDKGPAYASRGAAYALLSRIYLYMSGTWDNPNTDYAQQSIAASMSVTSSGSYSLLGTESFKQYNTYDPDANAESIFVVKRESWEYSGYDHYYGFSGLYANIGGMGWGEMYASKKYLDLLDETGRNDWRTNDFSDARAAFIEPTYSDYNDYFRFVANVYDDSGAPNGFLYYQLPVSTYSNNDVIATDSNTDTQYTLTPINAEEDTYSINFNGETYEGCIDWFITENRGYPQFYIVKCSRETEETHLHSPVISRLGEIYLNMAEAYLKMGQSMEAITYLNIVRERSIPGAGYTYSGQSYAELAELIEKERHLELAYQGERSYDIYRNGGTLTREYPGPHDTYDAISSDDYRILHYIPTDAITAYGTNTLTQNPTN